MADFRAGRRVGGGCYGAEGVGGGRVMPTSWQEAITHVAGSILGASIIAVGAYGAAARLDPKFVRVNDDVINIQHIVEVTADARTGGCRIIMSNALSREETFPDGTVIQDLAGMRIDKTDCDVLRDAVQEYVIDSRPVFVPRSSR